MIYLLYGPDTFRSREKLRNIVDEFKKKAGGIAPAIFRADAEDGNLGSMAEECRTPSFFCPKRLFIIERIFQQPGDAAFSVVNPFLKEWAAAADLIVLFWDEDVSGSNPALLEIKKHAAKTQEFSLLSGARLAAWLEKELSLKKMTLSPGVKRAMLSASSGDLWRLSNELGKIEVGFEPEATAVGSETKIWDLTDSFFLNRGRSLAAAIRLISEGEPDIYILGVMAKFFRTVALFKKAVESGTTVSSVGKALGMHPYAAEKKSKLGRETPWDKIDAAFHALVAADENIKTGKLPAQVSFLSFFLKNP